MRINQLSPPDYDIHAVEMDNARSTTIQTKGIPHSLFKRQAQRGAHFSWTTRLLVLTLSTISFYLLWNLVLLSPRVSTNHDAEVLADCESEMKIIGWNIFAMFGKPFLRERTEEIASRIPEYDIWLLRFWNNPKVTTVS